MRVAIAAVGPATLGGIHFIYVGVPRQVAPREPAGEPRPRGSAIHQTSRGCLPKRGSGMRPWPRGAPADALLRPLPPTSLMTLPGVNGAFLLLPSAFGWGVVLIATA
jgi:hypothetical protein